MSPIQNSFGNRRSKSFCREPRSPSWNEANFNSSAQSSEGKQHSDIEGKSDQSDGDEDIDKVILKSDEKGVNVLMTPLVARASSTQNVVKRVSELQAPVISTTKSEDCGEVIQQDPDESKIPAPQMSLPEQIDVPQNLELRPQPQSA